MNRPRILLADDHRMLAEGLRSMLSPEFDLVGVVEDGRAMVEAARELRPDVLIADITMPHLNGIEAMVQIKRDHPQIKVVILTMHNDVRYANRALKAGASGYVLKQSACTELVAAIRAALEGETFLTPALTAGVLESANRGVGEDLVASLTPRQTEILQLLAEGRSAKEIAYDLGISARTVEFHKYRLMEHLNLMNSAELIHFAIKHGVVAI
jgi:DNA-binding NarL/FixJ family response regulator